MSKPLIIDSNLLLLLIIGKVENGKHIRSSRRLKAFTLSDYYQVLKIMAGFEEVCITPYIATEVSNLIDLNGKAKIKALENAQVIFSQFRQIDVCIENDVGCKQFFEFGITDSSLIRLANDYFILTNDYRMLEPLFNANPDTIIPYVLNN